ncbi:hypothetical protein RDWZM_001629 [Blomia tropicalis]|uniref:Uncharacterized protein n=1 Tax=Blomia tropicalis TaxID=40697 RepID=A0A9Q0MCS8_BLOTA|nr:hypothetical protein RDWZM_001629 [Blomia tropicalis]
MSERRFTRLKASLSKETAAKTRETVSREIRQSLTTSSNNESIYTHCIDSEYERNIRQWNDSIRSRLTACNKPVQEDIEDDIKHDGVSDLDFYNSFTIDDDDIQVINETKPNTFDYARYYLSPEQEKPSSPFAHECITHYTDQRHLVRWKSMDDHFGTVFDTCMQHHTNFNNAYHQQQQSDGKCRLASQRLQPHLFECDLEQSYQHQSNSKTLFHDLRANVSTTFRLSTQNRLIREGSASVLSLDSDTFDIRIKNRSTKSGNASATNVTGWLTLSKDESNCFLTFYDTSRRDKVLWHIEVNRKVSKLAEPPSQLMEHIEDSESATTITNDFTRSCFRVNKNLIFTDQRYTDDWIKDINSNIGEEFDPSQELARILTQHNEQISQRLKSHSLFNGINLFAAYSNDLTSRMGTYPAMKNSVYRMGFRNSIQSNVSNSNSCFRFILSIKSFEIQSSDRNKIASMATNILNNNSTLNGIGPISSQCQMNDSFFLRISLFDVKHGKISEEFRFTISNDIKSLRSSAQADGNRGFDQRILCMASRAQFTVDLAYSSPQDVYLVLRIERTSHRLLHFNCVPLSMQTANSNGSSSSNRPGSGVNNIINLNNNKTTQSGIVSFHVEPYAWSIRPLFQDGSTNNRNLSLETQPNFGVFAKMDQNRLSDEFVLNSLRNLHGLDGKSNSNSGGRSQTVLNGKLEIELQEVTTNNSPVSGSIMTIHQGSKHTGNDTTNSTANDLTINSSLFISNQSGQQLNNKEQPFNVILEIQSLRLLSNPYSEYFNLLYIYPQSLKFDSQKVFSKARNICVTVEIRDSDEVDQYGQCAQSLPIIFGRPHDQKMFVKSATTCVSRHNVTPDFFEEIKCALPLQYSEKLHVLFTFAHISCKKDSCTYAIVGYSWLPISPDSVSRTRNWNPIHAANQQLSVFASLPNCYLSCQSLGLGKGLSMPDVKFVGKDLFRVSTILISSVASRDVDTQQTLSSVIKITRSNRDDSREISQIISLERSLPKMLQKLVDCDRNELIHFSPIILQQLFKLLVFAANQDLILESFRTILHLVDRFRRSDQLPLLNQFVEDVFQTYEFCGVYTHDQMIVLLNKIIAECQLGSGFTPTNTTNNTTNCSPSLSNLNLSTSSSSSSSSTNGTENVRILLNNLWFILRIMIKSMIQYLVASGRATLDREDRFEPEFVTNLKRFIESTSTLIATFSRAEETPSANQALAHFLTRLCSFFDRSVIFNAFYNHVCILSSRDIVVQELKLNAIAILLAHEHFVSFCNPIIEWQPIDGKEPNNIDTQTSLFSLTSQYARKHFPLFLILNEFRQSYTPRSPTAPIRPISLYIVRNQLAKHLLEDHGNSCSPKYKSNCRFNDRIQRWQLYVWGSLTSTTITGSGGRPNTGGSGKKSTSPYSTINEAPSLHHMEISGSNLHLTRSTSEIASHSSFGSLSSAASTLTNVTIPTLTHQRTNSMASSAQLSCTSGTTVVTSSTSRDKFSVDEVRDLFICLLSVVQVLDIEPMNNLSGKQLQDLFLCLECALNAFEYKPASQRSQQQIESRSKTLPNYLVGSIPSNDSSSAATSAGEILHNYLLAQNLSIQCSVITLRTIHLYLDNDQRPIDTAIIAQILSIYLTLMSLPQAQRILVDVFDSIRYFVQKFAILLFNSDAFLSPIIGKVIKFCNSSLSAIRQGATDLLYCLLSTNLKRTRFETIVCVSRLASSDQHGLLYLQSSLNRIEQLAIADHQSGTLTNRSNDSSNTLNLNDDNIDENDDEEVSILNIVGRIREILKATKQIREESFDPYLASELRLQLAHSYARTSRSLLRTWLENLAEVHVCNRDWAEAALCNCQVIAILIEQLSSKEIDIVEGMVNICKVSPDNIFRKHSIKQESDWLELEESHVSIEVLEKIIQETVDLFERAELYELAPHVLKVMVNTYEREYDHKKLSVQYQKMSKMHSKVQEINESGKRLFDTFFRIAFYHHGPYGISSYKQEYIYKLAKVVSLAEMTGIMQALYPGAIFLSQDPENVQPLPVEVGYQLDPNNNSANSNRNISIVITHVNAYVEGARNQYERSVGVHQFVYEQRIGGKVAATVAEQYKKRVILTVANSFPYFVKRILVSDRREVILSPIEVAIDEMQERVRQLEHVISSRDAKHLQLVLQGSVNATVNAGPIAYANAFLRTPMGPEMNVEPDCSDIEVTDGNSCAFSESQKHLKFLFEQFLDLCECALKLNEKLIKPNQIEYHQNLKSNFEKLRNELDFFHDRPTSIQIFDLISGSTFA